MADIFISYRREDAAGHAGRLCDRLNATLGRDRVFMDVEDVSPGEDFVRAIDEKVAGCNCLLVVIGPHWLEAMRRRQVNEVDFVRHEIKAGLDKGTTIVPVLVAGAAMPAAADLPADLAELSRHNAVVVRDDRFDDDVERLVGFLGGATGRRSVPSVGRRRVAVLAAAALIVIAALAWFIATRPPAVDLTGEWTVEMRKPPQPVFRVGMTLIQTGNVLLGTVRYPTGDGAIQDGRIDGGTVTFYTSHVPQFESEPAIIRFVGTVERDGIHLTSSDDNGTATGVAVRRGAP